MMQWAAAVAGVLVCGAAMAQPAGRWEGRYTCYQGETALLLSVRDKGRAEVEAVFQFYALDANPDVPDGCFTMSGVHDAPSGTVVLTSWEWLLQPPGYVMVDLVGQVSADKETLSGTVVGPGCTTFTLRRTGPPGTPAASCRGGVLSQR